MDHIIKYVKDAIINKIDRQEPYTLKLPCEEGNHEIICLFRLPRNFNKDKQMLIVAEINNLHHCNFHNVIKNKFPLNYVNYITNNVSLEFYVESKIGNAEYNATGFFMNENTGKTYVCYILNHFYMFSTKITYRHICAGKSILKVKIPGYHLDLINNKEVKL